MCEPTNDNVATTTLPGLSSLLSIYASMLNICELVKKLKIAQYTLLCHMPKLVNAFRTECKMCKKRKFAGTCLEFLLRFVRRYREMFYNFHNPTEVEIA